MAGFFSGNTFRVDQAKMPCNLSKLTAIIVLFFFTWTSGGVFSIANAAVDAVKKEKVASAASKQMEKPEERFARVTEELTSALADPKTGVSDKKRKLNAAKTEIEALDKDLRTQFAETEQKLKAAKLPPEILARHTKFVKHYDDNLAELKGNIERVEKAKSQTEIEVEVEKTLQHLEKVKAPSRHQKLDPNNLPHRQPKAIKREPRMKKEEFEKDLKKDKHAWKSSKRIMVATNGSVTGLLTSDDLAETIEVQFTPEIKAKALELGNNPVKIYEWVRNNVEFVPTWGSILGAQMTLLTKQGNAFDTASLLIALLRAAGINARYVTGTVELPIDKVMNWAGNFSDPMSALDFMSSGGIPTKALTSGGKVVAARFEHVWVEAFINYIPSRGAKHKNGKGDNWIPLDPSYKQYSYSNGIEKKEIVKKEYPHLLGTLPYRNSVRGSKFTTIPDIYRHKLSFNVKNDAFDISTFDPDAPIVDTSLNITKSLPELAGKKITLSYSPATPQDEAIINSFMPSPHADGTLIQPSELPSSLPAYLINLKPELRIDGQVVATGAPVGLGGTNIFTMTFSDPSYGSSQVLNYIDAGVYQAIGLNLGRISQDQLTNLKSKMEATKTKLQNKDLAGLTKDDLLGDILYTTALAYHAKLNTINDIAAKAMNVNAMTLPSETIFATKLKVMTLFGIPRWVSAGGLNMDADYLMQVVKAKDGNNITAKKYMIRSGLASSSLENKIPEQFFSTPGTPVEGISAVKALKLANNQGIPIYTINQTNM